MLSSCAYTLLRCYRPPLLAMLDLAMASSAVYLTGDNEGIRSFLDRFDVSGSLLRSMRTSIELYAYLSQVFLFDCDGVYRGHACDSIAYLIIPAKFEVEDHL